MNEIVESKLTKAERVARPLVDWDCWGSLILTTSVYCIVAFVCSAIASIFENYWFSVIVGAALFAVIQLTSMYAALGSESYWKRLLITQSCNLACGLSVFGGLSLGQPGSSEMPFAMMCFLVASSVASQLVFGLFRVFANWRIHVQSVPRGPVYNLNDLFALTTFLAVSLAALSALSPGAVADNLYGVAIMAFAVGIATMAFGIPTLITTFSGRELGQGIFSQLIIVVSIGFLVTMPFLAMGAQMVVGPLMLFLCCCSIFTWVPLVIMRERGLVLTTRAVEK